MSSSLLSLSVSQWEDLCDGCGRCCLNKLEDEDTGEIHYTNVACEYFDSNSCQCTDYKNRADINPRCMVLSKNNLEVLNLMPYTCAYRLKHENRSLDFPRELLSVSGKVISEEYIHDEQLPDHIVDWISVNS